LFNFSPLLAAAFAISDNEAYAAVLDEVLCNMKSTLLAEHARLLKIAQEMTLAECKSELAVEMASAKCNSTLDTGTQTASMSGMSEMTDGAATVKHRAETVMSEMIHGAETVIHGAETVMSEMIDGAETGAEKVIHGAETVMSEMIHGAETVTVEIGAMMARTCSKSSFASTPSSAFSGAHRPPLEFNEDMHTRAKLHLSSAVDNDKSKASLQGESTRRKASRSLSRLCKMLKISAEHPLVAVDSFMAMVILLNAISIGASCDTAEWHGWVSINFVFCILFFLEFLAKVWLMGCNNYFRGGEKYWHWFEVVLVILSVFEVVLDVANTGDTLRGSSLFRAFRLVRLTKLLRICRSPFVSDLVLMINGAMGGLRTLFWSLVLISLPLYVVALVLRETLGEEAIVSDGRSDRESSGPQMFSTLAKSFFTVFRCTVAGDCGDDDGRPIFVLVSENYGWQYGVLYSFTVVLMTFGLFNVIVAIYVENIVSAAKFDDARKKQTRLQDQEMFKEKSLELAMLAWSYKTGNDLSKLDLCNPENIDHINLQYLYDMEITEAEFARLVDYHGFSDLLSDLDIAKEDQQNLFETLDVDQSGTLDVNELVKGIDKLRGDARKAETVSVLLVVRHMNEKLATVSEALDDQRKVLESLQAAAPMAPAVVQLQTPRSPAMQWS
jgi:hypothetical protein